VKVHSNGGSTIGSVREGGIPKNAKKGGEVGESHNVIATRKVGEKTQDREGKVGKEKRSRKRCKGRKEKRRIGGKFPYGAVTRELRVY